MTLRAYLVGFTASSILSWTVVVVTLLGTNPERGGQAAILALFISLAVALTSSLTLIGYAVRVYRSGNQDKYVAARTSFRQALLVGIAVVAVLALQAVRLLAWWDIVLLVAILWLVELYLRAHELPIVR